MASPFPKLQKGKSPTLLDVDLANKVLDFLNGLSKSQISPNGAGIILINQTGMTIDLSNIMTQLTAIRSDIQALQRGLQNATITCNADSTITFTPGA